jgi:hypothetical protein
MPKKIECPACEGEGRILVGGDLYELCLCCWGNRKIYKGEFIDFAMDIEGITEDDYFEYVDGLSDSSEHKKILKSDECLFDWLLERYSKGN